MHVADAVQLLHGQRRQERFFFTGCNHTKPARPLQPRRDGRHDFRARRSNRNAQPCAFQNLHLQPPQRSRIIRIQPLGAGKVQIKIIQRRGFHRGCVGLQDASNTLGKIRVVLVLPRHDNGFRADAQRFAKAHRRAHAEKLGFVACRSHTAATHQNGLAAQLGIEHLLDRCKKCVHIHVHDVGNFYGGSFTHAQPCPGGPRVFLRWCFRLWRVRLR